MNFDTHRKNYTGLAFVVTLHLVAIGVALKNSTILINRADPGPVIVLPPPRELIEPEPEPTNDFDVPRTKLPVITETLPVIKVDIEPERTITTVPPEDAPPRKDPGGKGGGGGNGSIETPRRDPVTVAAVIDAADCSKPAYPAAALRNGDEGTVTLAFLIGKDGRVASAKVERTSGHRDLDRAALQGLSQCAFKPGTVDGVAQESWARMQYAWHLDE